MQVLRLYRLSLCFLKAYSHVTMLSKSIKYGKQFVICTANLSMTLISAAQKTLPSIVRSQKVTEEIQSEVGRSHW